ncbi:hypothetical protein [Ktedonospora formicarum]|uniref:hypothetical protein n=1 Tax=Ktedonospora formicarum TaxID=2778364 RepID=UPI001C692A83|nr:hypothetical protein [Ktedonospora formicarum]
MHSRTGAHQVCGVVPLTGMTQGFHPWAIMTGRRSEHAALDPSDWMSQRERPGHPSSRLSGGCLVTLIPITAQNHDAVHANLACCRRR